MRPRRAVAPSYAWRPRPYRTAPPRRSEARSPLEIQGQRPSLSRESPPRILMHPAAVPAHPSAVTRSQLRRQGRRVPVQQARQTGMPAPRQFGRPCRRHVRTSALRASLHKPTSRFIAAWVIAGSNCPVSSEPSLSRQGEAFPVPSHRGEALCTTGLLGSINGMRTCLGWGRPAALSHMSAALRIASNNKGTGVSRQLGRQGAETPSVGCCCPCRRHTPHEAVLSIWPHRRPLT